MDEHDWEGAEKLTKEEAKKVSEEVKQAIRQNLHANNRVGAGGLSDALGLEELVTPKVDWRDALRMFMNSTCRKKERSTWRRPNRRFLHQDIIMPTLEGNSINEVVLARDTSGSMFCQNRLTQVSSEMVGIVNTLHINKIHLIDWDGTAEHRGIFSSDTLKEAPELKQVIGGGGTDPTCVSDYLVKNNIKPDCVVMLTDGIVDTWGNWTVPVLWAIADNANTTAPLGKTIHID
jgi:predicted metal-dependent peptidase